MTAQEMQDLLYDILRDEDLVDQRSVPCNFELDTFESAGVYTQDKGLVIAKDDSLFQVTIVKVR